MLLLIKMTFRISFHFLGNNSIFEKLFLHPSYGCHHPKQARILIYPKISIFVHLTIICLLIINHYRFDLSVFGPAFSGPVYEMPFFRPCSLRCSPIRSDGPVSSDGQVSLAAFLPVLSVSLVVLPVFELDDFSGNL